MDCYRTCDIRGKYPDEINEDLFFQFGRNIAEKFLKQRPILIGSDLRLSSPSLKEALAQGLTHSGARVYDAGAIPTPVLYFGRRSLPTWAAAMVTASHNPPDNNGLKLLLGRFPATASQLRALKPDSSITSSSYLSGRIEPVDLADPYVDFLTSAWRDRIHSRNASKTRGTYVFDPGNGVWTLLVKEIIEGVDIGGTVIHANPDGLFSERSPDCSAAACLEHLSTEVRRLGAAAGLAWDGDGDRIAVCDNTGRVLFTDHLVLLLLPCLLRQAHKEKILCDTKMSRRIKAAIEKLGAIAVLEKSPHCYLERRMIKERCLFGCEYSGHLFFRSLGGADDGMYAALSVVDFLRHQNVPLSDLLLELPPLFITPDLRIPGGAAEFIVIRHRLRDAFPFANISEFDGIRVETGGAWLLARPSVSENKLSFRFEGETKDELDSLVERVMELLPDSAAPLLDQINRWNSLAT